jgi:endogenous inhibitor of DNA gyrase (YacG/DUF329 family)
MVDGIEWWRYPNAKKRNHRVYFSGYIGRRIELLHRHLWRREHGEIPKDCEVHHIDQNPLNNALENLECITKKQHRRIHADCGAFSSPEQLAHLERIRDKAKVWHASDEGHEWHRQHGIEVAKNRKPVTLTCSHCGKQFERIYNSKVAYCSTKCGDRARWPRKKHSVERVCEWCNKPFLADSKKRRFCSKSCAHTHYWAKRKAAGLQSDGERAA